MKKRIEQTGQRRRAPRIITLAAFALLAVFQAEEASAQWVTGSNGNTTLATGNAGIGTTAPAAILDSQRSEATDLLMRLWNTNPTAGTATFRIANSSNGGSRLQFTDSSLYVSSIFSDRTGGLRFRTGNAASEAALVDRIAILPGGNVGIGTTNPGSQLHVEASDAGAYSPPALGGSRLIIQNNNQTNGTYSDISFRTLDSSGYGQTTARITGIFTNHAFGGVSGDLAVTTMNAMTRSEVARFTGSGNVGIGTAAPQAKLHVTGDLRVDGNISAKYQDVAEWVPSTQKLNAGTVVILDVEHNNHVTTTATPYDTRVAGVVSAQPGIALGEKGEGKALIATTGRVKVRVDATRAPIRVGDLLVTGDTPGVAMRSQPLELSGVPIHRPGTLIGKALEPLDKGTGEILVLLSLQ